MPQTHVLDENSNEICTVALFQRVWSECDPAGLVSIIKKVLPPGFSGANKSHELVRFATTGTQQYGLLLVCIVSVICHKIMLQPLNVLTPIMSLFRVELLEFTKGSHPRRQDDTNRQF